LRTDDPREVDVAPIEEAHLEVIAGQHNVAARSKRTTEPADDRLSSRTQLRVSDSCGISRLERQDEHAGLRPVSSAATAQDRPREHES